MSTFCKRLFLLVTFFLVACNPLRGCVEAKFELAKDSRVPKWFHLQERYAREDISVEMTYYTPYIELDNVTFELMDRDKKVVSRVSGTYCWHPVMRSKRNAFGGFDPSSYPHFTYVKVGNVIEVIEHTRSPFFRISDDQELAKMALESRVCEKG